MDTSNLLVARSGGPRYAKLSERDIVFLRESPFDREQFIFNKATGETKNISSIAGGRFELDFTEEGEAFLFRPSEDEDIDVHGGTPRDRCDEITISLGDVRRQRPEQTRVRNERFVWGVLLLLLLLV